MTIAIQITGLKSARKVAQILAQTATGLCVAALVAALPAGAATVETTQAAPPLRTSAQLIAAVAPDATDFGPYATTLAEYQFPPSVDPDVLADRETEIWAVVHRPTDMSGGPKPVLVFLHGNHATCGKGTNPRIDDFSGYTTTGTCSGREGYVVVPNHRGYDYIAERLASWGYVVVSINANRGINAGTGVPGDNGLNQARGRLVLKHIQRLSEWNTVGGTPESLGVDLLGKLDFSQLGLMGHSRGGEGMRAAYAFYRDQGSPWPARIPNVVTFKGLFEVAPVDGQTDRIFDADDIPWTVLLPICDGDVSNLAGVRPYDRMMRYFSENVPKAKSTYIVWGTNHNYYNTEWQTSDSSGCQLHTPIFEPGRTVGSANQRQVGLSSLTAFMRGYVGLEAQPSFTQNFNPQFEVPTNVSSVTRIERGFSETANSTITKVVEDFDLQTGSSSSGLPEVVSNVIVSHRSVFEHDTVQRAGFLSWTVGGTNTFYQSDVTKTIGLDLNAYKTFELRLENQLPTTAPTDFSIALVYSDNTLSTPVLLSSYLDLIGPVGGPLTTLHTMLQSTRIPLADFGVTGGRSGLAKRLKGVRLIFNGTPSGAIIVANMRLSTLDPLQGASAARQQSGLELARLTQATLEPAKVITEGNAIIGLRKAANGFVELELSSKTTFPVRNELAVLRIGNHEFALSRYPASGETDRLIFSLSEADFAKVQSNEAVTLQYGRGNTSGQKWTFGSLNKGLLK
ncbi:MAG: hypothetical protein H7Y37_12440 [Anaerolineae bacterium]|nr:hypothetical protein [Gloeobacterales cyanobacterium ES-bin-313]